MLCVDRPFLLFFQAGAYFPLYMYMYMWDFHHSGTRPFQLPRGNTCPGAGTNFTRSSIIIFRTSASSTMRSTLPSTACSDSSESSRSERSFPHAATTCTGSLESGLPILSVTTIISCGAVRRCDAQPFSCKGFYLCPSCSQKRTYQLE